MGRVLSILLGVMLAVAATAALYFTIPAPPAKPAVQPAAAVVPAVAPVPEPRMPQFYAVNKDLRQQFVKADLIAYGRGNPMSYVAAPPAATNPVAGSGGQPLGQGQGFSGAILPVDRAIFNVTSQFGPRPDPFTGEPSYHYGLDIGGATGQASIEGQPVYAFLGGTVTDAGYDTKLGNYVTIDHTTCQATYGHLQSVAPTIHVGATVQAGQVIGRVGNTGRSTAPHLHFAIKVDGQFVNPLPYLQPLLQGTGGTQG